MKGSKGKLEVDCVIGGGRLDGVGFEDSVLGFGLGERCWMG